MHKIGWASPGLLYIVVISVSIQRVVCYTIYKINQTQRYVSDPIFVYKFIIYLFWPFGLHKHEYLSPTNKII